MAQVLREWLELAPEKVLFATMRILIQKNMAGKNPAGSRPKPAGEALGLALTEMMNDGEITRERALELAHMVLHDNAASCTA